MLKSKLKTTYKTAEPATWLVGVWEQLDPIFAGRLAQVAKATGVKIKLQARSKS